MNNSTEQDSRNSTDSNRSLSLPQSNTGNLITIPPSGSFVSFLTSCLYNKIYTTFSQPRLITLQRSIVNSLNRYADAQNLVFSTFYTPLYLAKTLQTLHIALAYIRQDSIIPLRLRIDRNHNRFCPSQFIQILRFNLHRITLLVNTQHILTTTTERDLQLLAYLATCLQTVDAFRWQMEQNIFTISAAPETVPQCMSFFHPMSKVPY